MAICNRPGVQPELSDALGLHEAGRLDEAEALYRELLMAEPENALILRALGLLLGQKGDHASAADLLQHALALQGSSAELLFDLGIVHQEQGKLREAIAFYQEALEHGPDWVELLLNLAAALRQDLQRARAAECYGRALALRPGDPRILGDLGMLLKEMGQVELAADCLEKALSELPDRAEYLSVLGNAYADLGRIEDAVACITRITQLQGEDADTYSNLGTILTAQGELDRADAAYRRAIGLNPELAPAHYNLALNLLLRGEYEQGWQEYEWRWGCPAFRDYPQIPDLPRWTGDDLSGRTILLRAEQGLGDTIQFVRYAPILASMGARVVVECPATLKRLFAGIKGIDGVMTLDEPLPKADCWCPLMSVPRLVGTTVQTIPNAVPYLHVDEQTLEQWRARIGPRAGRLRVGVVWAGNPGLVTDRYRSLRLRELGALARVPGVTLYSLQKGKAADQTQDPSLGFAIHQWTADQHDFAETAALIQSMDLVIAVDTSVAHLAGALGKPTWVLLPTIPDWRWQRNRHDSAWYSTMRLFRQRTQGDWASVVNEVEIALQSFQSDVTKP